MSHFEFYDGDQRLTPEKQSLTQTRLHFQNIVAGFTAEDERAHVDWPEDRTPFPSKTGDESRRVSKGKGKEVVREGGLEGAGDVASGARDGNPRSKGRESFGGGSSAKKKRSSRGGATGA